MFIWSYGIGCPAGLFVPTLTFGSAFGLFTGHLIKMTLGQWWGVPISFPSYAVIGAAAFLGGTTRMIVSVTVLVARPRRGCRVSIDLWSSPEQAIRRMERNGTGSGIPTKVAKQIQPWNFSGDTRAPATPWPTASRRIQRSLFGR